MCCGCDTSYLVSVHIKYQASIFTLSLCRGHSWRMRLAKQETLTPPGHLVSPLVCRGPWMSTVVLYCWCHSDGASVLLYFTWLCKINHYPIRCLGSSHVDEIFTAWYCSTSLTMQVLCTSISLLCIVTQYCYLYWCLGLLLGFICFSERFTNYLR